MSAPYKKGIKYYSHDTDMSDDPKIKLLVSKYGIDGYGLFNKMLEDGYKENGYFFICSDDNIILTSSFAKKEEFYIRELILFMADKGLFDKKIFDNYNILTSERMQRNFIKGVEARKQISMITNYLLVDPESEKSAKARWELTLEDLTIEKPVLSNEKTVLKQEKPAFQKQIDKDRDKEIEKEKEIPPEDDVTKIWRLTFGRLPNIPEREKTMGLIEKYGYDKTFKICKEGALNGFHNFAKLLSFVNEEGVLILLTNENNGNGKYKNGNRQIGDSDNGGDELDWRHIDPDKSEYNYYKGSS